MAHFRFHWSSLNAVFSTGDCKSTLGAERHGIDRALESLKPMQWFTGLPHGSWAIKGGLMMTPVEFAARWGG